jgi:hypothetical protein
MTIRICGSNRPRDPNGHITKVALRVGFVVQEWAVDGPSWRSVAEHVVRTLHSAGVHIKAVRASDGGRLLLGPREDWMADGSPRDLVEDTDVYLRKKDINPHAYLLVMFSMLPEHYGDDDFYVDYEPVARRPRVYRGAARSDKDERSLYASDSSNGADGGEGPAEADGRAAVATEPPNASSPDQGPEERVDDQDAPRGPA